MCMESLFALVVMGETGSAIARPLSLVLGEGSTGLFRAPFGFPRVIPDSSFSLFVSSLFTHVVRLVSQITAYNCVHD